MKMTLNERRNAFKSALIAEGIDVTKNFFALSWSEIDKVDRIRCQFGFSGRNYLGRSRARQFYYSAQKAK